MALTRLDLNSKGVAALLKDQRVTDLRRRASQVKARAGAGFEVRVGVGRTRARAIVITATTEARRAEATERRLSSALGAGRG